MRNIVAATAAFILAAPQLASAAAVNKIFSPIVEWGEKEVEARGFWVEDSDPARDHYQVNKLGLAYGATQWWWTELEWVFEKEPDGKHDLVAVASENVFQLTESGQYFADFGWWLEYEIERGEDVHEIITGPIVQKQFGPTVAIANLFFERKFGSDAEERKVEMKTAIQWKYLLDPAFEPGIEYYGYEEDQNLGPAAFGLVKLGPAKFQWQLAWLFGLTDTAADNSIRWMAEFEFQ